MTETIRITRTVNAPIERVYEAWTDPQVMSRWFYVGEDWSARVAADVRVGGQFRIEMETPTGDRLVSTGSYLHLRPPTELRLSWSSYAVKDSVVTIHLAPGEGRTTRLTLIHEGLPSVEVADRHANGWGATLDNLERTTVSTAE